MIETIRLLTLSKSFFYLILLITRVVITIADVIIIFNYLLWNIFLFFIFKLFKEEIGMSQI